ncbi:MAG: serine hydrolase [Flavobacteriales bacterium]|nr:serine hydrolase [Flavobacteriales bacterium]
MNRKIYIPFLLCVIVISSCVPYRFIKYGSENIDDNVVGVFDVDTIHTSDIPFVFPEKPQEDRVLDTMKISYGKGRKMSLTSGMDTINVAQAIVVVQNDSIIYENYKGWLGRDTRSVVFSVSKTITSLLCGIAIDEGYIKSVQDPVTDYIPELVKKDTMFRHLTIEHLLDMRAGLKFSETYKANPFTGMARLYYGQNAMKQIANVKFSDKPGETFDYNSMTTAILGEVIERATGMSYAAYLSEKVWKPMGMEIDAVVCLDDPRHRRAKSYAGIATCVRDLAKIGQLYLDKGVWQGRQVVDSAWVKRSFSVSDAMENNRYSYSWRCQVYTIGNKDGGAYHADSLSAVKRCEELGYPLSQIKILHNDKGYKAEYYTDRFYALGVRGQVVYVCPRKRIVAVFIGEDRIGDYNNTFDYMSSML